MVILVNENDEEAGKAEKLEAHKKGLLHRAISVFIFNSKNELLIQKRAKSKYHSPGLLTNTCCSHPFPKETNENAAKRRLKEEMGIDADVSFKFKFHYIAEFENGLTENEIDSVFIGYSDQIPAIEPEEVDSYYYIALDKIKTDIQINPNNYTAWFKIIIEKYCDKLS